VFDALKLIVSVTDSEIGLPERAFSTLMMLIAAICYLKAEVGELDSKIAHRVRENYLAWCLLTVASTGQLIAATNALWFRTSPRHLAQDSWLYGFA